MFSLSHGYNDKITGWGFAILKFYYVTNWPTKCKAAGTPWARWFFTPHHGWRKV